MDLIVNKKLKIKNIELVRVDILPELVRYFKNTYRYRYEGDEEKHEIVIIGDIKRYNPSYYDLSEYFVEFQEHKGGAIFNLDIVPDEVKYIH